MEKTKNNMKEKDILGFDPTQLSIYSNEDTKDLDNSNDDKWYKEECKRLKKKHTDSCIKSKNIKLYKKPLRVYLAGKIKQNGWRELIVGYRCNHLYGGDNVDLTKYTVKYNDQITITGPWFLSCDHGCYHGDNTHGLGINKMGCPDANGDDYSESEVYDICTQQIMGSDIVFAYIDDNTCYGSLYEIGLAKALDKKIIIVFDNGELMSDMWFICQGADITEHMSILDKQKHITIKDKFDEIINKLQ